MMDQELLGEFLTESNESLESIEQQLMDLEENPQNYPLLDGIFRAIHTIKGSCGFLHFSRLEKVAHAGENLLGKIRTLKFEVNEDLVSLLLECADAIKSFLAGIEAEGTEPELDFTSLITRLQAAERIVDSLANGGGAVEAEAPAAVAEQTGGSIKVADWAADFDASVLETLDAKGIGTPQQVIEQGFAGLKDGAGLSPADALKLLGLAKQKAAETPAVAAAPENVAPAEAPVAPPVKEAVAEQVAPVQPAEQLPVKAASAPAVKQEAATAVKPKAGGGTIRVDVDLLDSLMNQVGELVLTRNRLLQMISNSGTTDFMRIGRDVDHITENLQSQLLRTRMQPISTIWNNVPRVVRDMGKQLGKKIRVSMVGEETELDRTILAALKDPLTHILRNSCDHGIEMPKDRAASGKSEEGVLQLVAGQESGQIIIRITDDGGGIDASRVKDKAINMGLLTVDQAEVMSDRAILQLIFHPGLSTAKQVSNFSGRGVGMDVVRTEIEKVGGSIDIESEPGKGTTLRIKIPLTLAIIPTMIVGFGKHRFAIPQMSVNELISAPASSKDWEYIGGSPFFRLRGNLLPVLRLNEALQLPDQPKENSSIVVTNLGERLFGIQVDEIFGAEEIVVKPLGVHFQHLSCYGGCSILGDGHVIPIIDCNGLAQSLDLSSEAEAEIHASKESAVAERHELQHMLIFMNGSKRYAIPMSLVERLECLPASTVEVSGDAEVIQYRGDVISVVRWNRLLGEPDFATGDEVYGIILSDGIKRFALLVESIGDILEVPLEIKRASDSPMFLGTTVIQGHATEVANVIEVLKQVDPNWFVNSRNESVRESRSRILFVEDAPFFRNLVIPVLEAMRFEIRTANDGEQACEVLKDYRPDLILTDIEMPNMDGYALAHWVAQQPQLRGVPVVALTASPPDEDDHRRANFSDMLVKFDRDTLVKHLRQLMGERAADKLGSIDAQIVDKDQPEAGANV